MSHQDKIKELHLLVSKVADKKKLLDQIHEKIMELKDEVDNSLRNASNVKNISFNEDGLQSFKKHYWTIIRKSENESEVRVPKMYDMNLGWLTSQDEGYNYFKVNPVTNWISEIPPEIKEDLGFPEPLEIMIDGNEITGKDIDKAEVKFKEFVKRVGNKLVIKAENQFDIFAAMLREGIMPFGVDPVPEEFRTHNPFFQLPEGVDPVSVKEAVDLALERSREIVILPTGFGKTFIACEAANQLKPKYLFIVNKSTIPQWKKRLTEFPKISENDYDIGTYQYAIKHCLNKKYTLVVADEAQHAPADTFSQILKIDTEVLMGLSGSPFREDGRSEYLIAVFGFPYGARWDLLNNSRFYNPPTIHVWVYKDDKKTEAKFAHLLQTDKKTLIYCDSLPLGEKLSKQYKLPFIQGSTPIEERQRILDEYDQVIGSRVIDEGVSVITAEIGIEVDWKGVSRAQALQRAGRVMHNKKSKETEHHIIMTVDEYNKDKSRLSAYYEKGMTVIHHKEEGIKISDLVVSTRNPKSNRTVLREARKLVKSSTERSEPENDVDETNYPLLKYAGVKKIYQSLNRAHKKGLLFFIDPNNQNKSFTIENYCMAMGYSLKGSSPAMVKMTVLKPLMAKKAIIEKEGRYQQNFSNMISA